MAVTWNNITGQFEDERGNVAYGGAMRMPAMTVTADAPLPYWLGGDKPPVLPAANTTQLVAGSTGAPPVTTASVAPPVAAVTAPDKGSVNLPSVANRGAVKAPSGKSTALPPLRTSQYSEPRKPGGELPPAVGNESTAAKQLSDYYKAYSTQMQQPGYELPALPSLRAPAPVVALPYNPMDYRPQGLPGQLEYMAGGFSKIDNPFAQMMAGMGEAAGQRRLQMAGLAERANADVLRMDQQEREFDQSMNQYEQQLYNLKLARQQVLMQNAMRGSGVLSPEELKYVADLNKSEQEINKNIAEQKELKAKADYYSGQGRLSRGQGYLDPVSGQWVGAPMQFAPQRQSTPKDYTFQSAQYVLSHPEGFSEEQLRQAQGVMGSHLRDTTAPRTPLTFTVKQ